MTWTVIADKPIGSPLGWHEMFREQIEYHRKRVEAGTMDMAHRHTEDQIQLVVRERRFSGDPSTTWADLRRSEVGRSRKQV